MARKPRRIAGLGRIGGAAAALAASMVLNGCAGPPWYIGEPLGGTPAIPPDTQAKTVAQHRAALADARARGDRVAELAALDALEKRGALHPEEAQRFVELLALRARDWTALGRPIPLAADLRHIIALAPGRALPLSARLRHAERAAGDLWLGLGQAGRAEAEYRAAEKLGAEGMDFRFRAVWGASVADLDDATLDQAMAELPARALEPFTKQYVQRDGGDPRLLRRAWEAARTYGPAALRARLEALPDAPAFTAEGPAPKPNEREALASAEAFKSAAPRTPPAADDLLSTGPSLARVLLPAVAAYPQLLAPGPRSRLWGQRLLAEDPTSPDSLEVAALIEARAGRLGGAEQRLVDLVFYSPDRATGYERAAQVWKQVGDVRRECLAWDHATREGPVDDPRWCGLLACARRDPGGVDPNAIASYIREKAPALACEPPPGEQAPGPLDETAPSAFPPAARP